MKNDYKNLLFLISIGYLYKGWQHDHTQQLVTDFK